jgi:ribosome-binding protein aMBF1 (putative translation factor)
MKLQVIKSAADEPEYVLVPVKVFEKCREVIEQTVGEMEIEGEDEYVPFDLADYVNPAAQMRIEAGLTQKELAEKMNVAQAYVSKLENQDSVTAKALKKIQNALG